jgi:regulation of enolase protein 1 (concanavalin A-like superfamily)
LIHFSASVQRRSGLIRVTRKGPALDILYSLDGSKWIECRQGYLTPQSSVLVGPMCAAPEGKGFDVRFEDWKVTKGSAGR